MVFNYESFQKDRKLNKYFEEYKAISLMKDSNFPMKLCLREENELGIISN
jgi:hypothetical protein